LMPAFAALGWMPHGGLALANSVATTGEMAVLLYLIRKRLGGLGDRQLVGALGRMGLACLGMLAGLALTTMALTTSPAWLISAVSILVGGGVYGLMTLLLRSEEPLALVRGMRLRLGL
jgi:putative peptidoglycan lipid II flippase